MSHFVTCYPIPGKAKAQLLCEAFAAGVNAAGGSAHVCTKVPEQLGPGAAVFYGVRPAVSHLWQQALEEGRDWYYIDNAYFDVARERYFRVTKNAIQHKGLGESNGERFARLRIQVKPMRFVEETPDVVVCAQSTEFMHVVAGDPNWLQRVTGNLRAKYGEDRVIVRTKQEKRPLLKDLERAGLLVTWSSCAAVTALLEGLAVLCSPQCCATYAGDRAQWASVLADNQWTLDELRAGAAWRALEA